MHQQQRRRHDGTIRDTDGHGGPDEATAGKGRLDEVRQDRAAGTNVSLVDGAIREAMEERIAAVDGDGSSNAEDGRSWCQVLGQWHKITFAAAGAM